MHNEQDLHSGNGNGSSNLRYRVLPMVRYAAGKGSVLLYSQSGSLVRVVPQNTADRLLGCSGLLTLDEHAKNLQTRTGMDQAHIRQELSCFVEEGFFVSEKELFTQESSVVKWPTDCARITSLGIPTRNRPDLLLRATASYQENQRQHDRHCRIIIADGSDVNGARENRERLASLNDPEDHLWYAGTLEKQRYADLLVGAGLPAEVVTFALFGHPRIDCAIGTNRNTILLETLGEMVLCADDDSVCRIAALPGSSETLRIAGDNDAVQVRFFPDRASLLAASTFFEESVLSAHEQLVGRTLPNIVASQAGKVKIDGTCSHLLGSLRKGAGTIIASYLGVCGDAGMGSPLAFLMDSRGQRQRLFESETDFHCALSSREVMLIAGQPTISHAGPWLGNGVAADNRFLLPPFPPNLRGEDTVFGHLLSACFPDAYFAHLPRALFHDPPTQRSYPARPAMGFSDVLAAFIGVAGPAWYRGGSPDRAMRQLGSYLIDVSSPSQKAFDDELRKLILRQTSFMLTMMDKDASMYKGISPLWSNEMEKVRDSLLEGVVHDQIVPSELRTVFPNEEAAALTRDLVLRFGKLLSWWPDIVQGARWLHSRDQRLAKPLNRVPFAEASGC
ncbi:MAG: hypothetical protein WCA49_13335 [Candidatus Sulfotelmatobacter sp.]